MTENFIKNTKGTKVTILSTGCVIKEFLVFSHKKNEHIDIVLGFEKNEQYQSHSSNSSSIGCLVGRVAGRIGNAKFELDGKKYSLKANHGKHHLHGRLSFVEFKVLEKKENFIKLFYLDKAEESEYPSNVAIYVSYTLTEENELIIDYEYTNEDSKCPTIVNLTNHSYFNLNPTQDVSSLYLKINADKILELKDDLIPTGKEKALNDAKELDFRDSKPIGKTWIDHYFIKRPKTKDFSGEDAKEEEKFCSLECKDNGIKFEVATSYPGVQIYSSEHFDGSIKGKKGIKYQKYHGICFEAQNYPDAINNKDNFPSIVLKPLKTKSYRTIFSVSSTPKKN